MLPLFLRQVRKPSTRRKLHQCTFRIESRRQVWPARAHHVALTGISARAMGT